MNYPEPSFPLESLAIEGRYLDGQLVALDITGPRERRQTVAQAYEDGKAEGRELAEHLARLLILERLRTTELRARLSALLDQTTSLRAANARLKAVLASWPSRQVRRAHTTKRPFERKVLTKSQHDA
jgi:hypothetical protein